MSLIPCWESTVALLGLLNGIETPALLSEGGIEGQSLDLDLFLKCTSMRYALHTGGAGDRVREQELHNRRTFLEFTDADLETGVQPRRLRGEMLRLPNAALQV